MEVKLVVSYPNGKTEQKELKGDEAESFVGYKLGDTVDGGAAGVEGSLLITGGSDRDGFPMRKGVYGARRLKLLLAGGVGYHPKEDGVRRKKRVRGDTITDEIVQINTKVISAKEEAPAAAPEPAPVEEKAEEPAPEAPAAEEETVTEEPEQAVEEEETLAEEPETESSAEAEKEEEKA